MKVLDPLFIGWSPLNTGPLSHPDKHWDIYRGSVVHEVNMLRGTELLVEKSERRARSSLSEWKVLRGSRSGRRVSSASPHSNQVTLVLE